jgi:hypothetical protein
VNDTQSCADTIVFKTPIDANANWTADELAALQAATDATKVWSGSTYGACTLNACPANFYMEWGECLNYCKVGGTVWIDNCTIAP